MLSLLKALKKKKKKTKYLYVIFSILQAMKQYMLAVVWVIFVRFGSYSYVDTVYNGPNTFLPLFNQLSVNLVAEAACLQLLSEEMN